MKKTILFTLIFTSVFLSSNAQWTITQLPEQPSIRALDANHPENIWISGSKGSILNSKDKGVTWKNYCPEEFRHLDFRGVAVLTDSVILAMSAGDGSEGRAVVIKTADAGKSWKKVLDKNEKGIFFDAIKFKSPWTGFIISDPVDNHPYLLKTVDAGETWTRVENLPEISPGEASYASSNSCITTLGDNVWFHTQNRVFHSLNSGDNWQVHNTLFMNGPSRGIFGIFALDTHTLLTVGGDYLDNTNPTLQYARSDSGGQSWYTQKNFWRPGLTECISVFGNEKHLISVGTIGTSVSKDNGSNWTSIDKQSFHVVKCFDNMCLAAGPEGRVGIIKL